MTHHHRPSVLGDCDLIAPYMRTQDVKEITYSHGLSPLESLQRSFLSSQECNTIVHADGTVVGMFGIVDSGILASPWLLGTDKLLKTKRVMLPISAKWVEEMNVKYPLLLNYAHVENTVSIKWLKSLGFKFIKLEQEHGVGKQPFYQFVRIGQCVIQQSL
tara:strand:- start:1424 stop:1903 length:480 start_codon:yes stop_codon:yes gene_type:complete